METKSAFQSAIARPAIDVDPSAENCRISLGPVLRLKDIVVLSLSPGGFEGSSRPWGSVSYAASSCIARTEPGPASS